ncbi:MAG TPA: hypothetical protein VJQ46_17405 [Gemmatimonadales bacterium]|nr:hypothetical protein [Gemmatimonadales bacterium]
MTRTTLAAWSAAVLLCLATAACGGGSGDDSTGPSPAPQAGTITLRNGSSTNLVAVNISLCSESSWGPNRLEQQETVAPGALRSWTVEPGCYDVKASNGSRSASWFDRELTAGGALNLEAPSELAESSAVAAMSVKSR